MVLTCILYFLRYLKTCYKAAAMETQTNSVEFMKATGGIVNSFRRVIIRAFLKPLGLTVWQKFLSSKFPGTFLNIFCDDTSDFLNPLDK
jgi:hypothetical protein